MATPAVQAASCAGAATAVITTTVIVVPTAEAEPSYEPFGTDPNNDSGKVIKDFWPFLVDTSKNKDWWEWSFKRLQEDEKIKKESSTDFKTVSEAFDSSLTTVSADSKALNQRCQHWIKNKQTTDITSPNQTSSIAKNIWKFCSSLEKAPSTIKEAGKSDNYKSKLGQTKDTGLISLEWNDKFWALKDIWFKKQNFTDQFFKPFKEKSLQEACKKAYSLTGDSNTATADKPKADDVPKFCGFKIQTIS